MGQLKGLQLADLYQVRSGLAKERIHSMGSEERLQQRRPSGLCTSPITAR